MRVVAVAAVAVAVGVGRAGAAAVVRSAPCTAINRRRADTLCCPPTQAADRRRQRGRCRCRPYKSLRLPLDLS